MKKKVNRLQAIKEIIINTRAVSYTHLTLPIVSRIVST